LWRRAYASSRGRLQEQPQKPFHRRDRVWIDPNDRAEPVQELSSVMEAESGIILTTIVAVLLDAFFNGVASQESAWSDLAQTARAADH